MVSKTRRLANPKYTRPLGAAPSLEDASRQMAAEMHQQVVHRRAARDRHAAGRDPSSPQRREVADRHLGLAADFEQRMTGRHRRDDRIALLGNGIPHQRNRRGAKRTDVRMPVRRIIIGRSVALVFGSTRAVALGPSATRMTTPTNKNRPRPLIGLSATVAGSGQNIPEAPAPIPFANRGD
jgi:hypothetical protein